MTESTRTCKDCLQAQPYSNFDIDKSYSCGYSRLCKKCKGEKRRLHYLQNREEVLEKGKLYDQLNKEKVAERKRNYRIKNQEKIYIRNSNWKKANKDKVCASRAKYRAILLNATPKWLTPEHLQEIESFYSQCYFLSETTGIKHHVDHIEPLNGVTSTGLHVPWNLQVLPHYINESKGNKLIIN